MTFVRFGLIVTGRGEADFLPELFRTIMAAAHCTFEVIRKSEQLDPITSPRRILRMTGRGTRIPTIDEEQFGIPALAFLHRHANSLVLVIDDLEGPRKARAAEVFARYRLALDHVLGNAGLSRRAAVHFLVNMLEAYYFADAAAVNGAAGFSLLAADDADDVEMIPHPKNRLKSLWTGYSEMEDGGAILRALDTRHVLSRPTHCCWLRTMFAWCISRLDEQHSIWDTEIYEALQLTEGCRSEVTATQ